MATRRVSVTLDAHTLERVRSVVGPRGVSAYLDRALAEQLARDDRRSALLALLDQAEAVDPTPGDVRDRGQDRAGQLRGVAAL